MGVNPSVQASRRGRRRLVLGLPWVETAFLFQKQADAVQDAINKSTGVLSAVFFPDINGFIDGDFGRDVLAVKEFVHSDSHDIAIDPRHPAHLPVLGESVQSADRSRGGIPERPLQAEKKRTSVFSRS